MAATLCYGVAMTKLDLALARIAKLPPERQEAIAVQLEWLLDDEETGESLLTDEQWAEVERRLREEDGDGIPHEDVVREFSERGD